MFSFLRRSNKAVETNDCQAEDLVFEAAVPVESQIRQLGFNQSIKAFHSEDLLKVFDPQIKKIYENSGLSQQEFQDILLPAISNFIDYVQLLPGSERHHHARVGGLLQHSLEVCGMALRRAKGVAFVSGKEGKERTIDKIRWPIACGVAGLLHDVGKVSYDLVVRSGGGDIIWNPYHSSLSEFATNNSGYRVGWRSKRVHKLHEFAGLALTSKLIPNRILDWLGEGDSAIIPVLLQSVAGIQNPAFPSVFEVVHSADKESVAADLSSNNIVEAAPVENPSVLSVSESDTALDQALNEKPGNDSNVEASDNKTRTIFTDKLCALVPDLLASRQLVVNQKDRNRGVFWIDDAAAWATWPALFNAIHKAFGDNEFRAYPKDPGIFLDSLVAAGIVEKTVGSKALFCQIKLGTSRAFKLTLVRILEPDLIAAMKRYAEEPAVISVIDDEVANALTTDPESDAGEDGKESKPNSGDSLSENHAEVAAVVDTKQPEPVLVVKEKRSSDEAGNKKSGSAKREAAKTNAAMVSDYIRQLDNDSFKKLSALGDSGEILLDIGSALCHSRFKSEEFGVKDGILWMKWPKAAQIIDDEPIQILSSLLSDNLLLLKGTHKDFDVKPSGQSQLKTKGAGVKVVAFSKVATKLVISSFGLDSNGTLSLGLTHAESLAEVTPKTAPEPEKGPKSTPEPEKQPKPAPEPEKQPKPAPEPEKQPKPAPEPEKQPKPTPEPEKRPKSTPEPEKQPKPAPELVTQLEPEPDSISELRELIPDPVVVDKGHPVSEILHTFDLYISSCLAMYRAQLHLQDEFVVIRYASVIFDDATRATSLKKHWWARVIRHSGVTEIEFDGGKALLFKRDILPKTYSHLDTEQERKDVR